MDDESDEEEASEDEEPKKMAKKAKRKGKAASEDESEDGSEGEEKDEDQDQDMDQGEEDEEDEDEEEEDPMKVMPEVDFNAMEEKYDNITGTFESVSFFFLILFSFSKILNIDIRFGHVTTARRGISSAK